MLKNIRSIYITKIVFSFANEGQKLKIIKYNKYLQKKLSIEINNYRQLAKRYIIFEPDGKGKEYDII